MARGVREGAQGDLVLSEDRDGEGGSCGMPRTGCAGVR